MEEIILVLYHYKNRAYNKTTYNKIAETILQNINQIDNCSLERIAQLCFVSPATINRFMKQIGYENYSSFRKIIRLTPENSFHIIKFYDDKDSNDHYNYTSLASFIHASNKIVINGYGVNQLYHQKLQYNLTYLGKISEVYYQMIKQMERISLLSTNDLLIISSLEGNFLNFPEALNIIKKSKAKKVLITNNTSIERQLPFDLVIKTNISLLECYEKITYYYSKLVSYHIE